MKGRPAAKAFDGKARSRRLPTGPGVYVMRDARGVALYVGKAANLRKRVASYFDARPKVDRIMRMIAKTRDIEVSLTRSEGEALLLENEWIKSQQPRYNVLLRDDKSYPWLVMTMDHEFPRIAFHRGARSRGKRYLGPYPSAGSVRESINLIQKIFRIRNCEDSYFAHRSRPCLQYQIKRCTAPCVGMVGKADYRRQVDDALLFLQGHSQKVIARLIRRMEQAAADLQFEQAASLRDQIDALKQMQARQLISASSGNLDIIALAQSGPRACVQVVSFRGGRNLGQRSHFPAQAEGFEAAEILQAFLGQYYRERVPPAQLVVSHEFGARALYEEVFGEKAGHKVRIQPHPRGERREWLQLTVRNARNALQLKLAGGSRLEAQLQDLQETLGLAAPPDCMECFDISHLAGGETVGACVVFDGNGPVKSRYRRYNLKDITPGDDYAAIRQVLSRRYRRIQAGEGLLPDLVLVDGGRGQLSKALEALAELGLDSVMVMAVAKGSARRAGYEEWVLPEPGASLRPGPESPASHLVQQIRDEAHRFAVTGHRGRRRQASVQSVLEEIPGIGAARRRALLTHFGGLKGVRRAGEEELASVPGISRQLAKRIFRSLH
jgi:excinuclease ABC subunit C